jgi:hypothetical protein
LVIVNGSIEVQFLWDGWFDLLRGRQFQPSYAAAVTDADGQGKCPARNFRPTANGLQPTVCRWQASDFALKVNRVAPLA